MNDKDFLAQSLAYAIGLFSTIDQKDAADREMEIGQIAFLFPDCQYRSKPEFYQIADMVDQAERCGYTINQIHDFFSANNIPAQLDALIRRLAVNWRPIGECVDGKLLDQSSRELVIYRSEKVS